MSSTAVEEQPAEMLAEIPNESAVANAVEATQEAKGTYGQILKSSALVGGSSFLNIGVGMVRTKVLAMLLGPGGFGLFGIYGSIATMAQTLAGMGINSSGVRQIAEASSSDDPQRIAVTTIVLRRVSLLLGLIGAAVLLVFSRQISQSTFGDPHHAGAVAMLSAAVFFTLLSGGQGALIQGMRRIKDLAKMSVLGAVFGTIISVSLVYRLREGGIVPALVAIAAMTTAVSWWYSRRIRIVVAEVPARVVVEQVSALLKLGFAFMASGLLTTGVAYVVRILVLRKFGADATGIYQSAWTLGGLYVGFILQAMGADFYPRLTASAHDNKACNRLVNEQALVGLLIAGPGVIATLAVAPLILSVFYSSKFTGAVGILRWICLGTLLQVVTWPMGFIVVAKAKQALFLACELTWSIFSLGLAWLCMEHFGLNGAGIAFFGSYIFHGVMIYAVVHRLSGFRWSAESRKIGALFLLVIAVSFLAFYLLPVGWAYAIGIAALIGTSVYSLHTLLRLVPLGRAPRFAERLLRALRLRPAA